MEKHSRLQRRNLHSVRFSDDTKENVVQSSFIPQTVGCSWDKRGRVKELRIRYLSRKFLKIWRRNIFGRSLLHKAKCHYESVLLRKIFDGWKEESWTSGREWRLSVRAECHYRYRLLYLTLRSWQAFMSLQVEKKRLQQHRNKFNTMEDLTLKDEAVNIQAKIEEQSKASVHFSNKVEKKSLQKLQGFVSFRKQKKPIKASPQYVTRVHLTSVSWRVWRSEWHRQKKWQRKEEHLQTSGHLANQFQLAGTFEFLSSSADLTWCKEKAGRSQMACQHHQHRLERLSLIVPQNRTKWLNKNTALQHHNQTVIIKHWKLWKDRLEEAEDKRLQALTDMALTNYRTSLLSRAFEQWRRNHTQQSRMKELEWRADIWFAEHCLAHYFNLWCEYIRQKLVKKNRRHKADEYNKQRLCTWVLCTWRERSDKHKDEMLLLRIAILHEEQSRMQRVWARWRQWMEQQRGEEKEKQQASKDQHQQNLQTSLAQQEDNGVGLQARTNEQQTCCEDDLHCMRWALDRWKQFVQRGKIEQCHESKIVKHSFVGWKLQYRLKTSEPTERALWHWALTLQAKVLYGWRMCVSEQRRMKAEALETAQERDETKCEVSDIHQRRTTLKRALSSNQVKLEREQILAEKARKHYDTKLLSKVLRAWNEHRHTCIKYKAMKRQGILLQRLKLYRTYFLLWRRKFQFKVKMSEQTEQALWHWALTLQAKVMYAWRLWSKEQRRTKTEALEAAPVDKEESQSAAVTCSKATNTIRSLPDPGKQRDEEPQSLHIQRVVMCYAKRWKERALCKPPKKTLTFCYPDLKADSPSDSGECDRELIRPLMRRQPRRCEELFQPSLKALPYDRCQASAGAGQQLWQRISSSQTDFALSSSSFHQPSIPFNTARQSGVVRHALPQKTSASILDLPQTSCELLLPPTAFMSTENEMGCGNIISPSAGLNFASTPSDLSNDTTSSLMRDLMSIQQDMRSFQHDRKQLRLWKKVKNILQSWLQTSGKDEEIDNNAVCQQVKELEERIEELSRELARRRLTMRLHAERVQHLQAVLNCSGFSSLCRQAQM